MTSTLKPKKLLVWDGDNTLWNGTLAQGETVTLPQGRALFCKSLCDRGVLQSIASHNRLSDVERLLHQFDLSNYFLACQADFHRTKSRMVRDLMSELGLVKPEDVLFVDDDPFNAAEVHDVLGIDTLTYGSCEKTAPTAVEATILRYFERDHLTEEDVNRVAFYRSELLRKAAGRAYEGDRMDFLKSCEMRAMIRKAKLTDLDRIMTLVERANQMSAVDRVYDRAELRRCLLCGELYVMTASDKFGTYGLCGVVRCDNGLITLLTISCRLQGKGYGSCLLGAMINRYKEVCAVWRETAYNGGVRALYEWYGFTIRKEGDLCTATLKTTNVSLPHWIFITLAF